MIKQAPLLADDSGRTDGATSHPYLAISNILRERPVYHQAIACGSIRIPPLAFNTGKNGPLVNDNMLSLAEAAGIIGQKRSLTPFLPLLLHTSNTLRFIGILTHKTLKLLPMPKHLPSPRRV